MTDYNAITDRALLDYLEHLIMNEPITPEMRARLKELIDKRRAS